MNDMPCKDCGANTFDEYYMVLDEVWKQARGGRGLLCIGCLENRLCRRLLRADFKESVPINYLAKEHGSPRLRERLGGKL